MSVLGFSRVPLFLVHGTTTPRVKHADEGLFSAFLLSCSLFSIASLLFGDLPVVLTNQSKEGIRIRRAKSDAKARGCNESRRKCFPLIYAFDFEYSEILLRAKQLYRITICALANAIPDAHEMSVIIPNRIRTIVIKVCAIDIC